MSRSFLGLSNIYLKLGVPFVVVALVLMAATFAVPDLRGPLASFAVAVLFAGGVVLYLIGRIVQVARVRSAR